MAIGQIVYNLEDYAGSGGLVSTSNNDLSVRVTSFGNNFYESQQIKIFEKNILENIPFIKKIGIQAPPGTKFFLNGSDGALYSGQEIVVGRTGIYELDDNISITSLVFDRPKKYAIDIAATNEAINVGITQMEEAKNQFDVAYRSLKLAKEAASTSMSNEEFWEQYDLLHDKYLEEYNAARAQYIKGIAGIYVENSLNEDIHNIIIDYISEEGVE